MHCVLRLHCIHRFLKLFDEGKNKGKDQLKFTKGFELKLSHTDSTQIGYTDDFIAIGKILEHYGQSLDSFKDKSDALKRAQYLANKNQQEHQYEPVAPQLDNEYPEYSRLFFASVMGAPQPTRKIKERS